MRHLQQRLLWTASLTTLAIAGAATPAFAQADQPQAAAADAAQPAEDEAIVVTGSRIPQPNLTGASPITVVNSQDIRQTGTTRAEDLVNSLPQVFAAQGSNIANGATGAANIDLRGLSPKRTLVLLNGRRLLPGDPASSSADINAIPAALIDRVDVLTGGASSVYGADAVSGVVNFILDTHLEGIRIDSQYSFYQHENGTSSDIITGLNLRNFGYPTGNVTDGGTWDSTIAFGTAFADGRGHVTGYFGYRHIDPVLQDRRDYSSCSAQASTPAQVTAGGPRLACGGSATSANGSVILYDHGTSTIFQFGPNRTLIPGSTPYNFGPLNHFQRPDERYIGGVFADYEISPALHPYLEFMFMDDHTVAQIAPSGDFGNTLTVNCNNPLMSAQQRAIVCDPAENVINGFLGNYPLTPLTNPGAPPLVFIDPVSGQPYNQAFFQVLRRNIEGGPRQDDLQHIEYRGIVGMRGDLDTTWSYDAYYQYGRTNWARTYRNEFSKARLERALDVVDNPATPGVDPICRSAQPGYPAGDPNCVPFDVFGGAGAVSQAAVNYLNVSGLARAIVEETVASASITGDLGGYGLKFPWSENGIGIAAGVEYRKEQLNVDTDLAFTTGDLTGQGAAFLSVAGAFDVREAFAEVRIPIVEHNFIEELTLTGGYRYSDYSVRSGGSFSTDTYKVQIELAPVRDIRFRAGYNRAVRAPNIQELFAPQVVALDGATDPCSGRVLTAADLGCLAQGLHVGQRVAPNPAQQYNGLLGGNRGLTPEIADTWTAGVVIQPRFIPGLAISVDYFDIKINNTISRIGADTVLAVCGTTRDPAICGLIHRNPVSGSIWLTPDGYVSDLNQNIGGLRTKGIDINASYNHRIGGLGTLGLSFVGTYLIDLITNTGVSVPYDCTGLFGGVCSSGVTSGAPNPEWRHQARLTWTGPSGVGASLRWRYFGAVRQDQSSSNPNLAGNTTPQNERIAAQSYFDLAFTFRLTEHYAFRFGVNNLLDREPPLVAVARSAAFGGGACPAGPCNGNTYAQAYDALGRYIFAGVTLDF